jgi:ribose transport system ATP-binding protein
MTAGSVVLSIKNLTKKYPGVLALNRVSLDLLEGEVHALLGENGAGKSTLIKAVAGAITADGGTCTLGGQDYAVMTPQLSRGHGIEVIYQEFNLVPTMSVAENILLGDKISDSPFVDLKKVKAKTAEILEQLNIKIDPGELVRNLPPAQQQLVAIARAVSKDVKILIMDEPSAPLSVSEVEHMFDVVQQLKERGVAVIYISHRLEEVFRISDRVTVLRDGCYVDTKRTADTNRPELISLMVGRELTETYPPKTAVPTDVALEVKSLSGNGNKDISLSVRRGEIVGLSGLVGAGRTELAMVIFGAEPAKGGEIWVDGERVEIDSPADAMDLGISLLPEDRKGQALFLEMDVKWNISFPIVKRLSKYAVVDRKAEDRIAIQYKERLDIKTPSLAQQLKNLSGGNQQKVVLARSLAAESQILIFDEPTRGIDVGAKQEIYKLMAELTSSGIAILMISSDMEELLGMSDRIVVLCEGKLAGEVHREQFSQDRILDLASGTN